VELAPGGALKKVAPTYPAEAKAAGVSSKVEVQVTISEEGRVIEAIGSWLGLAFSALFFLGLAWRTEHEERVLRAELKGYEDYAARVRYRLIPFVW